MVVYIPLSKTGKHAGKYEAIVSDEDSDLAELNWQHLPNKTQSYAIRDTRTKTTRVHYFLHRVILERILGRPLEKGEIVDHINMNGLDNRRENLRLATKSQNGANQGLRVTNTSGYKGVVWAKRERKYVAKITINRKSITLGSFNTPQEAYKAYCEKAKEAFGEFVRLD